MLFNYFICTCYGERCELVNDKNLCYEFWPKVV